MDARAEAEKRYPALNADDEMLTYPREALRSGKRGAFVAGAAWALREAAEHLANEMDEPWGMRAASRVGDMAYEIEATP